MAATAGCGFLPIRKGGRLPGGSRSISFRDYTGGEKTLSLRRGLLRGREQVLMVDDWIETGAQMSAAIRLVQLEGAAIVGVTAINIDRNEGTEELLRLHRCHFVWSYDAASDA
jgi:adenine phosphoribosyltransferase